MAGLAEIGEGKRFGGLGQELFDTFAQGRSGGFGLGGGLEWAKRNALLATNDEGESEVEAGGGAVLGSEVDGVATTSQVEVAVAPLVLSPELC